MHVFPARYRWAVLGPFLLVAAAQAEPVAIVPADFANPQQPQVAIGEDDAIYVTFGRADDIYLSVSRDQAGSFSTPRKIGTLPHLALGLRRGPRIVAAGCDVTITAMAGNLFSYHSADGGESWSAPVTVNDVAASAREGLHALAAGPAGQIIATWLDLRSGQMEIYGAVSGDAGGSWGKNFLVYHSPDDHVCECCHPSATFNGAGDVAVMWRNWIDGSRDLWMATWSLEQPADMRVAKQGVGTWKLDGCPMDGGAVFPLANDSFGSVWRRENTIYLSLAPGREQRVGEGTQPFVVVVRGVVHVFWQSGSDLMHATDSWSGPPAVVAAPARFGAAAVMRSGEIVIVYEGTAEDRKSIFAAHLPGPL